jgi:hypothetical protein
MSHRARQRRRERAKKNDLVNDSDRRRRISICLKIIEIYDRMQAQFANAQWPGYVHPYIARLGIHNYVIEWKLHIKDHVDALRKNCEHLRSQLAVTEELDKEDED